MVQPWVDQEKFKRAWPDQSEDFELVVRWKTSLLPLCAVDRVSHLPKSASKESQSKAVTSIHTFRPSDHISKQIRKCVPLSVRREVWLAVSGGAALNEQNRDRFTIALAGALQLPIQATAEEQRAALHAHPPPTFGYFGPTPRHCLTAEGLARAHTAMCAVAYDRQETVFCPWVPLIVLTCMHWMDEADTFFVVCGLLREPCQLLETRIAAWLMVFAFDELARTAHPRALQRLCAARGLAYPPPITHEHPLSAFWLAWPARMPLPLLTRFVDVFISEGQKVVYRFGVTALLQCEAALTRSGSGEGWQVVPEAHSAPLLDEQDEADPAAHALTFDPLSAPGPASSEQAAASAFSFFQAPSESEIELSSLGVADKEATVTPESILACMPQNAIDAFLDRAFRLRFSRASVRASLSHHYPAATHMVNSDPHPRAPTEPAELAQHATRAPRPVISGRSSLLNSEQWRTLQLAMPPRFHSKELFLLFSTVRHGYSLTTLRTRVGAAAPTVLLLRTTDGDEFGAYCSYPWTHQPPDGRHFGNGETFVFSLNPHSSTQQCVPYPWVGTLRPVDPSQSYFMRAQADALSIGGSSTGAALHITSDLTGHSAPSPTFDSPAFVRTPTGHFAAALVEVWGFKAHR
eukprot:m.150562 g.150562  ORF g.150562 m.150562 type:complete len:634 (-) comp15083_c2_seq10:140-2041(-)